MAGELRSLHFGLAEAELSALELRTGAGVGSEPEFILPHAESDVV